MECYTQQIYVFTFHPFKKPLEKPKEPIRSEYGVSDNKNEMAILSFRPAKHSLTAKKKNGGAWILLS